MTATVSDTTYENLRGVGPKELSAYVGCYLTAFVGFEGYHGLLIKVEGKYAYIDQPRLDGVRRFLIGSTGFQRQRHTPKRPALARAIAYQHEWEATDKALRGGSEDGAITDQWTWDHRRGEWEQGLVDIHERLLAELVATPLCQAHPRNTED